MHVAQEGGNFYRLSLLTSTLFKQKRPKVLEARPNQKISRNRTLPHSTHGTNVVELNICVSYISTPWDNVLAYSGHSSHVWGGQANLRLRGAMCNPAGGFKLKTASHLWGGKWQPGQIHEALNTLYRALSGAGFGPDSAALLRTALFCCTFQLCVWNKSEK